MSFLDSNISEHLTARLTQKGRNAISKGNFVITNFVIGDSEFDYRDPFSGLTTSTTHQKVFSPFDKNSQVKYPLKFSGGYLSGTTVYGVPVQASETETLRNVMGPAGFVSNYKPFDLSSETGTTIGCTVGIMNTSAISGSTIITAPKSSSGITYSDCDTITIAFNNLYSGTTYSGYTNDYYITGDTHSLVYKVVSVTTGTTSDIITLDRNTPDLSSLTGKVAVICNKCEMEFSTASDVDNTCIPQLPDTIDQQNPWKLSLVWDEKPIGMQSSDRSLQYYKGNRHTSTKGLLGYTTNSAQIFTNFTGGTITGTTYVNASGTEVLVKPNEQRCVAIIHFSELGDITNYPERFFKYDDYISHLTGTTDTVATDITGGTISDLEYFEVYIPFLLYHRSTGTTIGEVFHMDSNNVKYIKSTINEKFILKYRDLLDSLNNKVGKVFVDLKTIVFDDQEIVAALDYKSNRHHTLPAPKVGLSNSDTSASTSLLSGATNQVVWVTYSLDHSSYTSMNSLPCNYFVTITGTSTPSNVTVKFEDSNSFSKLATSLSGITDSFVANKFYIYAQTGTTSNLTPTTDDWVKMDFTTEAGGSTLPNLTGKTFTINYNSYTGGTLFNLGTHLDNVTLTGTTESYFGDEQYFPGSIKLVRASDIEVLNFLVNLPSGKFESSQNPTYTAGDPMITEVALLDSNKEPLIVAKTAKPITRVGTQVFSIKLDF